MAIPIFNKSLKRKLFINTILNDPITVLFRGREIVARKNETSYERKALAAGIGETIEFELLVALEAGEDVPVIKKASDNITLNGTVYKITSVQPDSGADCYLLEVSKK